MKSYLNFLKRNKIYAAINVLGLALSMMFVVLIGGYAWQEAHVDSQYDNIDRIYFIGGTNEGSGVTTGTNWRVQHLLRDRFPEILSSTSLRRATRNLILADGQLLESAMLLTDTTFTDFFRPKLVAGDWSTALAEKNSIIVTPEYALKAWGTSNPIGKSINLNDSVSLCVSAVMEPIINSSLTQNNDAPYDIIGRFEMMEYIDWWAFSPAMNQIGGTDILLLAPEGVDLTDRAAEYQDYIVEACGRSNVFFNQFGDDSYSQTLRLIPMKGLYTSDVNTSNTNKADLNQMSLYTIAGTVILLFALMNYVNLTVSLSSRRAKEMAMRRLLGSNRRAIIMRFVGEGILLCAVATILGMALAFVFRPVAEYLFDGRINLRECATLGSLALLVGIVLLTGALAGIIPAIIVSTPKPIDVVRGSYRRTSKMVFSKIFIIVQNTITIVMLASAFTIYLQYKHIIDAPLGYDFKNVISVPAPSEGGMATRFVDEVKKMPMVENVSVSSSMPLYYGHNNTCQVDGSPVAFQIFWVDKEWFPLFRIGIEEDRGLSDGVFVNKLLLDQLNLPADAPDFPYPSNDSGRQKIRGTISDITLGTVFSPQRPVMVYMLDEQTGNWNALATTIFIRVNGDQADAYERIHNLYAEITGISLGTNTPYIQQQLEQSFSSGRRLSELVAAFALIALVISILGLVAMSSYYVEMRSLEIAVRKVYGATSDSIIRASLRPFALLILVAFAAAIPIVHYLMGEWLAQYSYHIDLSWWIYALSGGACMIVSIASILFQTRKAANSNPINALHQNI